MRCVVGITTYPEPCSIVTVHGVPIDGTDEVTDTNIINIQPGIPEPSPASGTILDFLVEFATDSSAFGYTAYPIDLNGIPGAPFGFISGQVNNYDARELSWGLSGGSDARFYFALTDAGEVPVAPFFTSLSFTDDNDTTWTLVNADSMFPGGRDGIFGPDAIQYWDWIFPATALPVVTDGATYELTVVV